MTDLRSRTIHVVQASTLDTERARCARYISCATCSAWSSGSATEHFAGDVFHRFRAPVLLASCRVGLTSSCLGPQTDEFPWSCRWLVAEALLFLIFCLETSSSPSSSPVTTTSSISRRASASSEPLLPSLDVRAERGVGPANLKPLHEVGRQGSGEVGTPPRGDGAFWSAVVVARLILVRASCGAPPAWNQEGIGELQQRAAPSEFLARWVLVLLLTVLPLPCICNGCQV